MRYALLSVSDKTGLSEFARVLVAQGFVLVSSGGTARHLEDDGLEVQPVEALTGFPECLDGRVKTLHPKIHGGILYRRGVTAHERAVDELEMARIDLVACNLYPFESKALAGNLPIEDAIEYVDIGGPTMIRSAAKNWEHVAVLTAPSQYQRVMDELSQEKEISRDLRRQLAGEAFNHTARYDALIARYFQTQEEDSDTPPEHLVLPLDRISPLRYGENPHQGAAYYTTPGGAPGVVGARQLHGKALSYNNLLDLDGAWGLAAELPEAGAVVVKHTNPCGAAVVVGDIHAAYKRALSCDPLSAFGGIVALNTPVTESLAQELTEIFLEIVAAPDFSEEALACLKRKKNLRIMKVDPQSPKADLFPWTYRAISGGALIQDKDGPLEGGEQNWRVATERSPTDDEMTALRLMWTVCRHVKSNAIVCGDSAGTRAVGAGQMSRVDAVELCQMKAKLDLQGSVAASDAFFPFRDGLDALADAGVKAVIQPGGSVRDQEVIDAANERGIAMIFTGNRHFRH